MERIAILKVPPYARNEAYAAEDNPDENLNSQPRAKTRDDFAQQRRRSLNPSRDALRGRSHEGVAAAGTVS
jgi:hypothetical protein